MATATVKAVKAVNVPKGFDYDEGVAFGVSVMVGGRRAEWDGTVYTVALAIAKRVLVKGTDSKGGDRWEGNKTASEKVAALMADTKAAEAYKGAVTKVAKGLDMVLAGVDELHAATSHAEVWDLAMLVTEAYPTLNSLSEAVYGPAKAKSMTLDQAAGNYVSFGTKKGHDKKAIREAFERAIGQLAD
jgi:hypothetical protein